MNFYKNKVACRLCNKSFIQGLRNICYCDKCILLFSKHKVRSMHRKQFVEGYLACLTDIKNQKAKDLASIKFISRR